MRGQDAPGTTAGGAQRRVPAGDAGSDEDAGTGRSTLRNGLGGPRGQRPAPSRRRRAGGTASSANCQSLSRFSHSTYKGPAPAVPARSPLLTHVAWSWDGASGRGRSRPLRQPSVRAPAAIRQSAGSHPSERKHHSLRAPEAIDQNRKCLPAKTGSSRRRTSWLQIRGA